MKDVDCLILGNSINALGIGKSLFEEKKTFLIFDLEENSISDYLRVGSIMHNSWNSGLEFLSYFNNNVFPLYDNTYICSQSEVFVDKINDDFVIKKGDEIVKSKILIYSPAGKSPLIFYKKKYIGSNAVIDSYHYKNYNVAIFGSRHAFFEQLYAANLNCNNVTVINYLDKFYPSHVYENISDGELSKASSIYHNALIENIIVEEDFISLELNVNGEINKFKFSAIYNGLDLIYNQLDDFLLTESIEKEIILSGIASGIEYYEFEKLFNEGYKLGKSLLSVLRLYK